jgi:hypothetical protein
MKQVIFEREKKKKIGKKWQDEDGKMAMADQKIFFIFFCPP